MINISVLLCVLCVSVLKKLSTETQRTQRCTEAAKISFLLYLTSKKEFYFIDYQINKYYKIG